MFKRIAFSVIVVAIFATHIIFSLTGMSNATNLTNSTLLAILVVTVGILFTIKD